jgi:hypothetical protein
MMGASADTFQFFILTELVRPFPLGKLAAESGKKFQSVFPKKKPVYFFRMIVRRRLYGVKAADGKFGGKFVAHDVTITEKTRLENNEGGKRAVPRKRTFPGGKTAFLQAPGAFPEDVKSVSS